MHFEAVGPGDTDLKSRLRVRALRNPGPGQFTDDCYIPRDEHAFRSLNQP